jgi:hypothetical protein
MLYDLLITSGIPQEFLDQSVPLVKQFNDPTKEIELKQTIGSIADLDPDDRAFIFDVINAKLKILALNLDSPTITSELVAAFKSFSLTKPKIALMLKRHATITDFTTPKNSELQDVFNRIFS